jgi:hypothetical protein
MQEQIAELEAQLAQLKQQVGALSPMVAEEASEEVAERSTSRRRWLGAAGASAVGAAVALGPGQRVAADDPNDVVKDANNIVVGNTRLTGGTFEVRDTGVLPIAGFNGSLMGFGGKDAGGTFNGVIGSSRRETGYGVIAMGDRTAGVRSQLFLYPEGPPPPSADSHEAGELAVEGSGTLWYCSKGGFSPEFHTMGGPGAAGAFYPIDPVRAFDSRVSAIASSGIFSPNSNRTVPVKDGYGSGGAVTLANAVPQGATAVTCNVTVAGTTGPNFLAVTPGDATEFTASSINWSAASQSVANGITAKLDGDRQVKVFCGDQTGSTQVVLDITGYYI